MYLIGSKKVGKTFMISFSYISVGGSYTHTGQTTACRVLPFQCVGPWDYIQAVRLSGKDLYQLSHLTSTIMITF